MRRHHTRDYLSLCARDVLAAAKHADVRRAHLGDHCVSRAGARRKTSNLARSVHAHLEHKHLGIGRCRKNRQGHTDKIIEVATRHMDTITAGKHL